MQSFYKQSQHACDSGSGNRITLFRQPWKLMGTAGVDISGTYNVRSSLGKPTCINHIKELTAQRHWLTQSVQAAVQSGPEPV